LCWEKSHSEIQGGSQELAVMSKNFNNHNSGKFVLPSPQDSASNLPELSLLKFLLLPTITAISWPPPRISHLFHNGLLGGCKIFYSLAVLD